MKYRMRSVGSLKLSVTLALMIFSISTWTANFAGASEAKEMRKLILDDFNDGDSTSSLGTSWQTISDGVMGGRSDIVAQVRGEDDDRFLAMRGEVSLKNNGGFIQVRLPLSDGSTDLNASEYSGFYISVRGRKGPYFLHLRTPDNRAPWSYYAAKFPVSENWTTITVPWSAFETVSAGRRSLDIKKLETIGIVAAEEEFQPELDISEIGLYRSADGL
jgi:hypothetical protein